MKKNKLIIEYEFDFELFGIATAVKGYKLAWEINRILGINLVKKDDLRVGAKKNTEVDFLHYAFETRLNRLKLFKNKPVDPEIGKYYLIPEFPHFDFILLTQMEEQSQKSNIPELLKQIPVVEYVSAIPVEGLKSKVNFVF
jgi:hypothetical protein